MPLYTVEPSPHKPLTDAEKQVVANSDDPEHEDYIDLESRIKPLTADTLNKILGNVESKPTTTKKSSSPVSVAKTTSSIKPVPKQEDDSFEVNWDEN